MGLVAKARFPAQFPSQINRWYSVYRIVPCSLFKFEFLPTSPCSPISSQCCTTHGRGIPKITEDRDIPWWKKWNKGTSRKKWRWQTSLRNVRTKVPRLEKRRRNVEPRASWSRSLDIFFVSFCVLFDVPRAFSPRHQERTVYLPRFALYNINCMGRRVNCDSMEGNGPKGCLRGAIFERCIVCG